MDSVEDYKAAFLNSLADISCKHSNDHYQLRFKENGDRILACTQCNNFSLSLPTYFCCKSSLLQVQYYVQWTRDYTIPCRLRIHYLYTRLEGNQIVTDYATIVKGCKLLQLLIEPFQYQFGSCSKLKPYQEPARTNLAFFQNTLQSGLDRCIRSCDDSSVGIIVKHTLYFLKNLCRTQNYFTVLAPYVMQAKARHSNEEIEFHPLKHDFTIDRVVSFHLHESSRCEKLFSKFSLSFDAVQVAALCYLCQDSLDTVYDLALDFLGKACWGYYEQCFSFLGHPLETEIHTFFAKHDSARYKTWIHHHLELCWNGGEKLEESLSESFFKTHFELKAPIVNKLGPSFELVFPRLLFSNYLDYYAFSSAMAHYSKQLKLKSMSTTEILRRVPSTELIEECKDLFRTVKACLSKVKAFHECLVESIMQERCEFIRSTSNDLCYTAVSYCWSKDLLKRFFDYDAAFERELVNVVEKWVVQHQEENVGFKWKSVEEFIETGANKHTFCKEGIEPLVIESVRIEMGECVLKQQTEMNDLC